MTPLEFLKIVWPDEGLYCICTPYKGAFLHHVFETIDLAATMAKRISTSQNVYFATGSLRAARIWNVDKKDPVTNKVVPGWSHRIKPNILQCKVLFFDLDVDPTNPKKYTSQIEAAEALKAFCKATSLPKPMIVSSGGGLHVYWILDRALNSADAWFTQAARLRQIAAHYKLKFDPSRTTDSSSVLRVAGTFNVKHGGRREVQVLAEGVVTSVEDWDKLLRGAIADVDLTPRPERVAAVDQLGSNTTFDTDLPAPSMVGLLKACPQMQRLARLGGKFSEPEWYAAIGTVKFTLNGRANCHQLSSGHPTYSFDACEAKIDQWNKNPTTCQKFENDCGPQNAHICHGCKYYKRNEQPIALARLEDTAPAPVVKLKLSGIDVAESISIPDPPHPWKRTAKGIQFEFSPEVKKGEAADQKKSFLLDIYPYDLYPIKRHSNTDRETEQHLWRAHLPHRAEPKDFTVEAATSVEDRALQARLANVGVYAPKFQELKNYMSAYIQELQKQNPATDQHNSLGWTADKANFVMPDKVFQPDGTAKSVSLGAAASNAREYIGTKGTLAKQIELLHFFDNPAYVAHQFFMLSSLGSILLYATGQNGLVLNATGQTGASKSTALYTAASFWGPPLQYVLDATDAGTTPLFRANRRSVLKNLPLCLDEITHIANEVAKTFAMNSTQNSSRGQMNPDGTPKSRGADERASVTMTSSNTSLHSILQIDNKAGAASSIRVLEILMLEQSIHKGWEADAYLRELKQNYGHIGEQFLKIVVRNHDKIVNRVIEKVKELTTLAKGRQYERFWFADAAAALVAGEIAVRMGLIVWDVPFAERWFMGTQLPIMRGTVAEEIQGQASITTLTNYLNYIDGKTIKTVKGTGGNLGAGYGSNTLIGGDGPRGEIVAHYETDNKIIYVLKDAFRRWCEGRGQYSQAILKDLHSKNIVPVLSATRTLGQGTTYAKGKSLVFVVNVGHPAIADAKLVAAPAPVSQAKPAPTKATP